MKKYISILFLIIPLLMNAQMEVGLFAGVSNYRGELSPESFKGGLKQTHANVGGIFRLGLSNYFGLSLNANYGKISGNDAFASTASRVNRNLSFKSNIFEANLLLEFNILGFQPYNYTRTFSPYLFAGGAFYHYNPKTYFNNQWIELKDLGTEGQGIDGTAGKTYSTNQFSIPMGIGVKYAITDKWVLGFKVGARMTFNDYIDDISTSYVAYDVLVANKGIDIANIADPSLNQVSQHLEGQVVNRGDASKNDWYIIGGFFVTYVFADNGLVGARKKNRRGPGCYN